MNRPQPANGARHRNYCLTVNNYTDADEKNFLDLRESNVLSYFVYGREIGANGNPHLQAYVELARQYRFSQVRTLFPRAHLEPRRGTQAQAVAYCKKDGEIVEDGIPRAQGARSDMEEIKTLMLTNPGDWQNLTAYEYFSQFVRYHKGFEAAAKALNEVKESSTYNLDAFLMEPLEFKQGQPHSHVLWGESGVGKTQFALAHFENPLFVSHMDDLLTFTSNHDGIVFDDMSFTHLPRTAQIHLVDCDQTRSIHCRYRTARIPRNTPKIFTTNEAYGAIFLADGAINRRITITEMEADQWIPPLVEAPLPIVPVAPPLPNQLVDLPGNQLQDPE